MPGLSNLMQALDPVVLVALTDDNGDGLADTDVVDAAIAASDAFVRDRLEATVDVPEGGNLPPLLDDIVLTLSVERLFERRRDVTPGVWTQRAERARRLLDDIASGALPLAGVTTRSAPVAITRTADDLRQPPAVLNLY